MPLPYQVWTEEQIDNRGIVPEGNYPFEVTGASLQKTKGKNGKPVHDMLVIDMNIIDTHGQIRKIRDWIVFVENMDWKLRHLANTTLLLDHYEAGTLEGYHLLGKKGVLVLGLKEEDGKKMNSVKDYVKQEVKIGLPASFVDDDIPM